MQIILDGAKLPFYPQNFNWRHQNGPTSEFITCRIGKHDCFVKRQSRPFSGWTLLVKAISNSQIRYCPRVLSIAKNNDHFYFFTEQLNGDILERVHHSIDGKKLINSMFIAIYNINKFGFWYSDLCSKNIFLTNTNSYYLIDIDSSFPHHKKFHFDLSINYEYSAILVKFGSETGRGDCDLVKGHNGESMNQAMLIAIAMDIRHSFKIPVIQKDSVIHGMLLRFYEKDYMDLFTKLINGHSDWIGTRKLIDKIFK